MRKILTLAFAFFLAACGASAQVSNQPFSITIIVNPLCTGISLATTTLATTGPANAGDVVSPVAVTTTPASGNYLGTITLGGTNASSFALTNSGKLPTNLIVGPNNLAAGTYSITLSCS